MITGNEVYGVIGVVVACFAAILWVVTGGKNKK